MVSKIVSNGIHKFVLIICVLVFAGNALAATRLSYSLDASKLSSPPIPIAGQKTLEAKEKIIEQLLSKEWVSPEGLIYSFVFHDTNKRITQDDILKTAPDPNKLDKRDLLYNKELLKPVITNGKPQYLLQGIPLEDVESYEDSLRSTSTYLSGLYFKYRTTADPNVLEQAHKVFMALYSVYELGLQEQRGWIPKPYGFRCTKQSSMDNQCPYYMSMIRYYKIASEEDKKVIQRVLTDLMDYWMRNKYHMHVPYFGMEVDYATDRFYPGHWPLLFLPLAHSVWEMTDDEKYHKEYNELLKRLDIDKGKDPDYLRKNIRCFHRWYLQYAWLLEIKAPPEALWLKGLKYQKAAMPDVEFMHEFAFTIWLDKLTGSKEKINLIKKDMLSHKLSDYLLYWPGDYYKPKTMAWNNRVIYTLLPAIWFKTYWHGKYLEKW